MLRAIENTEMSFESVQDTNVVDDGACLNDAIITGVSVESLMLRDKVKEGWPRASDRADDAFFCIG